MFSLNLHVAWLAPTFFFVISVPTSLIYHLFLTLFRVYTWNERSLRYTSMSLPAPILVSVSQISCGDLFFRKLGGVRALLNWI
jgi:hypothetical protein